MAPGTGHAIEEFARRKGDFAIVGIAAVPRTDGERCTHARLVASGIGGAPQRLRDAEDLLLQGGLGEDAIGAAAEGGGREVDPMSDPNASAAYRRRLVAELARRALRPAAASARAAARTQGAHA